jgi:hypothetical protein
VTVGVGNGIADDVASIDVTVHVGDRLAPAACRLLAMVGA